MVTNYSRPFVGNLGSHIYDQIPDVLPGHRVRESGVYEEIPELPIAGKERADSTGSSDSNRSFGKQELDILRRDDNRKKNIAEKVLRRRSFVKEKTTLGPKSSLSAVASGGVVLVGTPGRSSEDKRFGGELPLPVNENKGSILRIFRTLKRSTAAPKPRGVIINDLF